jgi:hypothetical protein
MVDFENKRGFLIKESTWKRVVIDVLTIVASILLAFAIDAWWDEFRDREDANVVLISLHEELVQVEEFMPVHDQLVSAMQDSARQLLTAAIGQNQELGEREIDLLLADLTWFISESMFAVPELESLILNDELSLIEDRALRHNLKSWRVRNQFFRSFVELQARFHNDRFMPYLEEHSSLQQIFNVAENAPGFPEEPFDVGKIEPRELRPHSLLLDDPVFQNLLARRISRLDMMLGMRDEQYVTELRDLIAQVEQELAD